MKKKIRSLYELKNEFVKEILILKSAFSIIDEMFIKEMENAEIKKKYWLRYYFIDLFGSTFLLNTFLNTKDPKELNDFVKNIMIPYKENEQEIKLKYQLNMIKLIEITLVLLVLTGIVHIGCTSWVNFQKASLEIEHKKHMFEY